MSKISVIVPVYKAEPYLYRCVDSILEQTFTDFELLLVDDGSPDNCGKICDEYIKKDKRVIVFHQENKGQSAARNMAINWVLSNSESQYICFIDSDDWVHQKYLELLYTAILKYETNISQCLWLKTDGSAAIPSVNEHLRIITPEEQYIEWYSASFCNKLFRRSIWENLRFPEGQIYEDVATWYKLLFEQKQIALVEDVLYYYYINKDSTVHKDWTPSHFARIKAWDKQVSFLSKCSNDRVLKNAIWRYNNVARIQYNEIKRSSQINDIVKTIYTIKLKYRIIKILKEYRSEIRSSGLRNNLIAWAFPRFNWCYWTMIGIKNKIIRIIR